MASDNAALSAAVAVATATLDRIKPPAGVIMPPPGEMREVIEKTAGYAVRGGAGIEARLRENHSNNPKFSFVTNPDDAFHAYYEWRKDEYRSGRVTAVAAGRVGDGAGSTPGGGAAQAGASGTPADGPKGPEKPPDYAFSARLPIMNAKDLDVLRLAASFVAVHGRPFMTQLLQREVNNAQFQFLLPNHSLHNYFQHMVDQYTLINKDLGAAPAEGEGEGDKAPATSSADRLALLRKNADERFSILLRAKQRIAYRDWEASQRKKEEHARVVAKEELARIDWTNFTVLETIVFSEADDAALLPPPTSLNDLQYASLEEKSKLSMSANRMIEEAFPFEAPSYGR
ncbi:splicing factor 3A subunit 1 [Sporothrix schenckii 1099-18]|uniref:Splicing factor 3A subunit 1 n=1 Tax=Sporothrix schenckii 1099-18 TaxID=1397361 RepID=A0A0F2MKT7_SPOSC|nr:splicing factor 3A subunit 1 [Sporothrix schenckii 1099-18]KJR89674.1 splicing factor 3A subunit 1 [Sporothrix schenckii 1099-18]